MTLGCSQKYFKKVAESRLVKSLMCGGRLLASWVKAATCVAQGLSCAPQMSLVPAAAWSVSAQRSSKISPVSRFQPAAIETSAATHSSPQTLVWQRVVKWGLFLDVFLFFCCCILSRNESACRIRSWWLFSCSFQVFGDCSRRGGGVVVVGGFPILGLAWCFVGRGLRLAEAEKGSMSSSMVYMIWIGELQAYFFCLPGLKCVKTQGEGGGSSCWGFLCASHQPQVNGRRVVNPCPHVCCPFCKEFLKIHVKGARGVLRLASITWTNKCHRCLHIFPNQARFP